MDIKKKMNKEFPNSLITKFINEQNHPLGLGIFWGIILVVAICCVAILTGSGKYSHPLYKHHLENSCQETLSNRQLAFLRRGTAEMNSRLKSNYYQLNFSQKRNILTMELGNTGNKLLKKAQNGNQLRQVQVTNMELSLLGQSRQLNQTIQDKKIGVQIISPNGTLLAFSKQGKLQYSVLPTLSTVK